MLETTGIARDAERRKRFKDPDPWLRQSHAGAHRIVARDVRSEFGSSCSVQEQACLCIPVASSKACMLSEAAKR
jgi:hypothetical protein